MTRNDLIWLTMVIFMVALAIWGWWPEGEVVVEEPAAKPEQIEAVVHDVDFARGLCDPRPVDMFDPTTGKVECARWEPTVPVASVGEPEEQPEQTEVLTETLEAAAELVFRADEVLDYPDLATPDYSRQAVFPDVPHGGRPALVAYEVPFEDGDYFEDGEGDIDIPQFYFRVMTAGTIRISQAEVDCVSTETQGCLVILINHFGETLTFRDAEVDNGFTVAGRVWDMSKPDLVTLAGQALLDHYVGRMTQEPDGANCGTIDACKSVEWHVVVVGNGEVQTHWQGEYFR